MNPDQGSPASVQPEPEWSGTGLSQKILDLVAKAGFKIPTPVQAKSIPFVLEGHDVIVSSQTGSGKTASFVLPMVERLAGLKGTYGLVLSPTREIALQTQSVFETFAHPLGVRSIVLIGGTNMSDDEAAIKTYPQIIVATPGRLCDHLDRGRIWLDYLKFLVLDEADRMLDMGFADQLMRIMDDVPDSRQTLVYSATFGPSVDRLVKRIMHDPKQVTIGTSATTRPKIEQRLIWLREEEKFSILMRLLREETGTIIVFARSKDRVSQVWRKLHSRRVYDATYIHSDITQVQREKAMAEFKSGKYRILVATDVVGRGIDVEDIAHVINFDLPREAEDYVHRIGRTGRKGKTGIATSLVTSRDRRLLEEIEQVLGQSLIGKGSSGPPPHTQNRNDSRSGPRRNTSGGRPHRSGNSRSRSRNS